MKGALPVVAIVGRPNVGKSTLFNRIVGRREAIASDLPGVTRDRNYGKADHEGRPFLLVDTGGFEAQPKDPLIRQVRDQARLAIDEAEVVVLVVDGVAGPTAVDEELTELLRRSGKRVMLAVNKIDSARREEREYLSEFHRLGMPEVFPVSAEHGRGVDDLLDAAVADFPRVQRRREEGEGEEEELEAEVPAKAPDPNAPVRLAIIGRPNVGKSTLLNALLGEERFVVSPVAGTTRDPVDAEVMVGGRRFVLTDTAGIRRKRSISLQVEGYSVVRALRAAEASDVVVLLLDATELAVEQDARIAGLAEEQQKPIVVVVNKWDLVPEGQRSESAFREQLSWRMPFLSFAPILFTSAITGERVRRILEVAGRLHRQSLTRVPTPRLNKLLEEIAAHHGLPVIKGARARVYYIAQTGVAPPTFVVQTNRPDLVPPEYRRYVANRIREVFELEVPIRLVMRRKASLRRPAPPARKPGARKPVRRSKPRRRR